ncbi:MAG: IS3 family transposase [Actinomycetota bacterium]
MRAEQDRFGVTALCKRYGVSRAGYYAWCKRSPSARDLQDEKLAKQITAIFESSKGTYGSPRIHQALRQAGVSIGRKRVARLMQQEGLKARAAKIYRRNPGLHRFYDAIPNQVLGVTTTSHDQVWVGDVTYLMSASKRRYLAVVMDRHSRRVLGWKIGQHKDVKLTTGAFDIAVERRKHTKGIIFHSDRGSEYSAYSYRNRVASLGMVQSMKRPREITDNAFMESFFHSMKAEAIHGITFDDEAHLRSVILPYIRRYNRTRLHSSLGYRSPIDFERETA